MFGFKLDGQLVSLDAYRCDLLRFDRVASFKPCRSSAVESASPGFREKERQECQGEQPEGCEGQDVMLLLHVLCS
ncbi:hypothetical protein D3C79_1058820 [compost metagenome]